MGRLYKQDIEYTRTTSFTHVTRVPHRLLMSRAYHIVYSCHARTTSFIHDTRLICDFTDLCCLLLRTKRLHP